MDNRQLLKLSQALQGKSTTEIDRLLREKHLDPQERIAVKHAIASGVQGRSMRAGSGLATDGADDRPRTEMQRILDRVGVDATRQYTAHQLGELMQQAGLDAESRIAVRIECSSLGLIATGLPETTSVADRLLLNLGISGPMTLTALEDRMDRHGIGSVALRTVTRRWHRGCSSNSTPRPWRASAPS